MRWQSLTAWLALAFQAAPGVKAIEIDVKDKTSITDAAVTAANNMLTYYNGTKYGYAPGILTNPYYWWEAGAMFGILIHFWHLTGNDTFNDIVYDGLLWQRGAGNDFEPANQTKDLGNDDQSFWAYAALDAAEFGFPNPPDQDPSWLALAQAVFNRQIQRWDTGSCGGGMRWQIYSFNPGWTYKNTAANGGLFQISARLARFTGNSTYADNANKMWDWLVGVNFVQTINNDSLIVIDGAPTTTNCSVASEDGLRWTYNHGTVLMGAAYMYNYTNGSSLWRTRLDMLIKGTQNFMVHEFNDQTSGHYPTNNGTIMTEAACEELSPQTCKVDQPAFKGMLVRWLAVTTQLAPYTRVTIYPWLNGTAYGASQQCTGNYGTSAISNPTPGGAVGTWCGRRWYQSEFDGYSGLGEQMSSMSAFQNVLIANSTPPYTTVTGGNSTSDPNAGNTPTTATILSYIYSTPVSKGSIAGAWILTAFGLIIVGAGTIWMVREEDDNSWGGSGAESSWLTPAAGSADYYRKTSGYGAYRLAGLSAGGVYAGKNASARRAFGKATLPSMGMGQGGWWFGSGRGVGEKWWDRQGGEYVEEMTEAAVSTTHVPRDSVNSYDSRHGLFSRMTSSATGRPSKSTKSTKPAMPGSKDAAPGEWKKIGKGVFVRSREVASGTATPATRNMSKANIAQSTVGTKEVENSRSASPITSRAGSVARGKAIHWPAAPPEPEEESEGEDYEDSKERR